MARTQHKKLAALCLAPLIAALSCKEPTQATVLVRTNVPYRTNVSMALWSSATASFPEGSTPQVTSAEPWLDDGTLGDVVITPRSNQSEPLSLRVVLGIGRDPAGCTDASPKGCIVARRKLAFVPRSRLRVPIVLHLACEGVVCDANSTCNYLGRCVSAAVDPSTCSSAEGCALPGDETVSRVSDAGASSTDASDSGSQPDASPDSGSDGGVNLQPLGVPSVSIGRAHVCAVVDNGLIKCWGANNRGQLGLGDNQDRGDSPGEMGPNLPTVNLGAGRQINHLAAGFDHTCARLNGGDVKCWGGNESGQLGLGDTVPRGDGPGQMSDGLPVVDLGVDFRAVGVRAGIAHTCALSTLGRVKCWGANAGGVLGLGDTLPRGSNPGQMGASLPEVDLGSNRYAVELAVGGNHVCTRLDNGAVKCWGDNSVGQLGVGDSASRGVALGQMGAALPAADLGPGRTAVQIAIGRLHSCALLDDSTVKCWGGNALGQLGVGDLNERGTKPAQMGATLPAIDLGPGQRAVGLSVGASHACVQLDDNSVKCWGDNAEGQLGLGDVILRGGKSVDMGAALPAAALGGLGVLLASAGRSNSCVRFSGGSLTCWGNNSAGQLGLGDMQSRTATIGPMGALPFIVLE
jgi:alpha-tubulin suppressor-like RCC1 family protein